jgi:hypothetical protein
VPVKRVALFAVTLLLAGCGDDEEARRAVVAAAERTTNEGPIRVTEHARIRTGEDAWVEVSFSGTVDATTDSARLEEQTTLTGAGPHRAYARQFDKQDGDIALGGDRAYVRMPRLTDEELAAGGRWVSFPRSSRLALRAGLPGSGGGQGTLDITRPVDHARAADDVEREDEGEQVNGRPTTRYGMTIDFDRYLDIAEPDLAADLRKAFEQLEQNFGTTRFPATAWIDEAGVIVRFESKLELLTGRDVATYRLDLEPADEKPALPRDAVPLRKLAGR